MNLLRAFLNRLTSPENDPWLKASRAKLEEFYRNHPHLKIKDVSSRADNTDNRHPK